MKNSFCTPVVRWVDIWVACVGRVLTWSINFKIFINLTVIFPTYELLLSCSWGHTRYIQAINSNFRMSLEKFSNQFMLFVKHNFLRRSMRSRPAIPHSFSRKNNHLKMITQQPQAIKCTCPYIYSHAQVSCFVMGITSRWKVVFVRFIW